MHGTWTHSRTKTEQTQLNKTNFYQWHVTRVGKSSEGKVSLTNPRCFKFVYKQCIIKFNIRYKYGKRWIISLYNKLRLFSRAIWSLIINVYDTYFYILQMFVIIQKPHNGGKLTQNSRSHWSPSRKGYI